LSPPSKSNFDLSRFHALKDRYTSAGIQIPRNFPDEAVKYYYLSLKDRVKRLFKKVRSWVEAQNADSMRYILLNQDMSASLKSWLLTQHTFTPITIPCNVRDPRGTLRKYALCYNDSRVILGRETAPPPAALTPFYDYEQLLTLLPNLDPVFALPKILEYGKTVVDLGSYRVVEKYFDTVADMCKVAMFDEVTHCVRCDNPWNTEVEYAGTWIQSHDTRRDVYENRHARINAILDSHHGALGWSEKLAAVQEMLVADGYWDAEGRPSVQFWTHRLDLAQQSYHMWANAWYSRYMANNASTNEIAPALPMPKRWYYSDKDARAIHISKGSLSPHLTITAILLNANIPGLLPALHKRGAPLGLPLPNMCFLFHRLAEIVKMVAYPFESTALESYASFFRTQVIQVPDLVQNERPTSHHHVPIFVEKLRCTFMLLGSEFHADRGRWAVLRRFVERAVQKYMSLNAVGRENSPVFMRKETPEWSDVAWTAGLSLLVRMGYVNVDYALSKKNVSPSVFRAMDFIVRGVPEVYTLPNREVLPNSVTSPQNMRQNNRDFKISVCEHYSHVAVLYYVWLLQTKCADYYYNKRMTKGMEGDLAYVPSPHIDEPSDFTRRPNYVNDLRETLKKNKPPRQDVLLYRKLQKHGLPTVHSAQISECVCRLNSIEHGPMYEGTAHMKKTFEKHLLFLHATPHGRLTALALGCFLPAEVFSSYLTEASPPSELDSEYAAKRIRKMCAQDGHLYGQSRSRFHWMMNPSLPHQPYTPWVFESRWKHIVSRCVDPKSMNSVPECLLIPPRRYKKDEYYPTNGAGWSGYLSTKYHEDLCSKEISNKKTDNPQQDDVQPVKKFDPLDNGIVFFDDPCGNVCQEVGGVVRGCVIFYTLKK